MFTQQKAVTWGNSNFFARNMVMQHPVPHTVAQDPPDASVPQPKVITEAMLATGHQDYDVFCAPCHAFDGSGRGMVVRRGFPKAADLNSTALRHAPASFIDRVITHGIGKMYPYGSMIEPAERWDIVAYVRALQLSQHAEIDRLPARDKAMLAKYALPANFHPKDTQPKGGRS